jgi:LuxR family maltose regulon positive regulatory protein
VAPGQKLDRTEHELLRLLTDGRTNREIAATLGLSQAAVERALTEMYARLGVSSRSEATALALRGQVAQ